MKYIRFYTLSFIAAALTLPLKSFSQKPKKALFVIVDGISSNSKEMVPTPHMDAIAKVGGYARAYVGGGKGTYSQTPTISAVGYNSLLTGTWVNKHNVWDNAIKAPNYHYWTIFRFFHEAYPHKKSAIFSTWLDNRTKLVGEGLPQTNHLRLKYSFDGFELDTIRYPHKGESDHIRQIDELVTNEAASYIRNQAPDLSWVYLQYTDDIGHRYGDSDSFHKAIQAVDDQMGRLWAAIQYREKNFNEDWLIVITTDHGRDAKTGQGHGGQSDRERSTWIVTNAKNLNENFKNVPGIVDIMPVLARHMDITIPKEQAFEIDGVPFTGKLSLTNPEVKKNQDQLLVSWKAVDKEGTVKVWLSTTNNFENGERDFYYLLGEVPVSDQKLNADVSKYPKGFYKVVLEGRHNNLNRWLVGNAAQ